MQQVRQVEHWACWRETSEWTMWNWRRRHIHHWLGQLWTMVQQHGIHTPIKTSQSWKPSNAVLQDITRNYERTPGTVTELLKQLEFEPLQDRRRQLRLCMLFKIVNELVVVPHNEIVNLAQWRTRGSHCSKFDTMKANTDTLKYSFFPHTIRDWNSLPENIVTAPFVQSFKERLRLCHHQL